MEKRLVGLSDGTRMNDLLLIFETNVPIEELKELEKTSCQVYLNGGNCKDVPIWASVLKERGFSFKCIDSSQHVSPYSRSDAWMELNYPEINEHYAIENQPILSVN